MDGAQAANDVKFTCSDGTELASANGGSWGDWGPAVRCPAYTHVCGLSVRHEMPLNGDNSAMNGLDLHCCAGPARTTRGVPSSIQHIQRGDVAADTAVVIEGIAASGLINSGFFVMDPEAGEFSCIWVYLDQHPVTVTPGDVLRISGTYTEYKGNSQIKITGPDDLVKTGTAPLPTFPAVAPSSVTFGSVLAESYEGMCVTIKDARVTAGANQNGDFAIEGGLKVNNRASKATPAIGQTYASIIGCMESVNNYTRLVPRSAADLVK